jgi:hypothetical protein
MPLPSGVGTCAVTGTYLDAEGNAVAGSVVFYLSVPLIDATDHVIVTPGPYTATLVSGAFSLRLPFTDNADVQPAGFSYQVFEQVPGGRSFYIQLPSALGSTVDLSTLAASAVPSQPIWGALYGQLAAANTWAAANVFASNVTVAGTLTLGHDPTLAAQAATKNYVDTHGGAGSGLIAANNLSDVASASTSRTNLGLGGAATLSVGTASGTVAAGDDSRIAGAAQKSANLADLASASTARGSLGLGGAAVLSVGTTSGTVAAGNDSRITGAIQPANAATTIVTETGYGQSSAVGVDTTYAREDHTHGSPSLTGAAPSATEGIGQAAALGVATTPARADHVHPLAAAGSPHASAVGDAQATGSATTFATSDHVHAREAFAAPASATSYGLPAVTGTAATLAHSDHTHGTPALTTSPPATTMAIGTAAALGTAVLPALADHVHPMAAAATPTASAVGDAAAVGAATTFASSSHVHGREAFGTVSALAAFGTSSANGTATTVSHSDHQHGAPALPSATTSTAGIIGLDGTAGDIAALGIQAAGAVGKAADAGHVHPTTGLVTSLNGSSGAVTALNALIPTGVKTSAYTAAPGDLVPVNTTSGTVAIALPPAPADRTVVAVKHVIQGGANTVTVNCGGSDVFNKAGGGTSATLALPSQAIFVQYAAASGIWYVLSDDLPLPQLDLRYAQLSNNLSDLTSASTARTNLGLGTAAVEAVNTTAGTITALGVQAAGASGQVADAGHVHPTTGVVLTSAAATTVQAGTSYGTASAVGTDLTFAREDHQHGTVALTSSAPATTEGIGQAAAVGTATTPARADHVHPLAASATAGASAVADTASAGSATTFAASDHRHSREAFGSVTANTVWGAASANGSATTVARSDHTHGLPDAYTYDTPAQRGLSEWNFPIAGAYLGTQTLVSGTIYGVSLIAQTNNTVSNICVSVQTQAVSPTTGQNLMALYSVSGTTWTQIGITGDLGVWGSGQFNPFAMGGSVTLVRGNPYVVLILSVAGTAVKLNGNQSPTQTWFNTGCGITGSPWRRIFTGGTTQTALPSPSFSATGTTMSTTATLNPWVALS